MTEDAFPSPALLAEPWAPATAPRAADDLRLGLLQDGRFTAHTLRDLPDLLRPGDLLVLNDAATLPAALPGWLRGQPIELRLLGTAPWRAVLLPAGDADPEDRPPPPPVLPGDVLRLRGLSATVRAVTAGRLLDLDFGLPDDALWPALYRAGRPVQYAHVPDPLHLWDVVTPYGGRPWAVEAPSAGLGLDGRLLVALRRRGVALATVTHGAGLSTTGDLALDAQLPLPERTAVPAETVEAVARTRAQGGRVIAVGTSATRALEGSAARHGALRAWEGVTDLRLSARTPRRVVDGLLSGLHAPGSSHHALLQAFAAPDALARIPAATRGWLGHEFGDLVLLVAPAR